MTVEPYIRRVVCYRCGRLMIEGHPPTVDGTCVDCGQAIDRERRREEWRRLREKVARKGKTPEQLKAEGDPFAKLVGHDED